MVQKSDLSIKMSTQKIQCIHDQHCGEEQDNSEANKNIVLLDMDPSI
jgi:hypothetical protein